jgi:hypothetical protein
MHTQKTGVATLLLAAIIGVTFLTSTPIANARECFEYPVPSVSEAISNAKEKAHLKHVEELNAVLDFIGKRIQKNMELENPNAEIFCPFYRGDRYQTMKSEVQQILAQKGWATELKPGPSWDADPQSIYVHPSTHIEPVDPLAGIEDQCPDRGSSDPETEGLIPTPAEIMSAKINEERGWYISMVRELLKGVSRATERFDPLHPDQEICFGVQTFWPWTGNSKHIEHALIYVQRTLQAQGEWQLSVKEEDRTNWLVSIRPAKSGSHK